MFASKVDRPQFDFRSIIELPKFSAFQPVKAALLSLPIMPLPASFRYLRDSSSSSSGFSSSTSEITRIATEMPFRNWMLENDTATVENEKDRSELDSPLPSPSRLPFFPRRRKESRKERRARTTFTGQQTQALEIEYHRSEYISRPRRYELAKQLNLKEVQIKIWYQNRRAKDKRIEKASWDRQYRCLDLATVVAVSQFPKAANYGLQTGFNCLPQHPLHMFPSSSAASFALPFLNPFQGSAQIKGMDENDKRPTSSCPR